MGDFSQCTYTRRFRIAVVSLNNNDLQRAVEEGNIAFSVYSRINLATRRRREKLISYYFSRFERAVSRRDRYPDELRGSATFPRIFLRRGVGPGEQRETVARKNPFDLADTISPGCPLCSTRLLSLALSFLHRWYPSVLVDFTRHEIGRPNKANCRTFLAG